MTCASLSLRRESGFVLIIKAMLSKVMKTFRYIRPTKRWPRAQQERATARDGIHFNVIEGDQGRDFDTLLKLLRPGNGVLVENLQVFARSRKIICDRLRAIFARQSVVIDAKGNEYRPENEAIICEAVMTGGYVVKEPTARVAHNKTSDEKLERAREMWTGEAFAAMTNVEIARATGISTVTLNKEFGARGRKAGRPRKR